MSLLWTLWWMPRPAYPVEMQRKAKENPFSRLSKLQAEPIQLMPMICGEQWGYRRRVRLSFTVEC